jgi:hypothetical protein
VRWGIGRRGMGAVHEAESLNGSSEGNGIDWEVRRRGGGGGGARRATGNDRVLELAGGGSDTGAVRQAALARPGGILSI